MVIWVRRTEIVKVGNIKLFLFRVVLETAVRLHEYMQESVTFSWEELEKRFWTHF